jgi:hypothetical protein
VLRAFPCPVGQFRLAYVAGSAANTGVMLTLTLYWAPVESLTAQIAGVEEVKDGALCRCARRIRPIPVGQFISRPVLDKQQPHGMP